MIQQCLICIVLIQWAVGSLVDGNSAQFIADYFTYKRTNTVTTFTCSNRGTLFLHVYYASVGTSTDYNFKNSLSFYENKR
jgi:hypothetical protein